MERVLGAISAASTATGRPSSVARQPEALRSRSMTRVVSPELEDAIRTSYLMAGGPVARGGFLASSGKAGPRKRRTEKNACSTGLLARLQRRWRQHRKRGLLADFRRQEKWWNVDGEATRPATWCESHLGENRVPAECGGRGRRWS